MKPTQEQFCLKHSKRQFAVRKMRLVVGIGILLPTGAFRPNIASSAPPDSVVVDLLAIEKPDPKWPNAFHSYEKLPKGRYVQWQAASGGFQVAKYKLAADQKWLEILIVIRNDGKEAFKLDEDKIVLGNGKDTKWWEAISPGLPIRDARLQPSFDKATSTYEVGFFESKGGECNLQPGEQTFLMILFIVPSDWNAGSLVVTPTHQVKIEVPRK